MPYIRYQGKRFGDSSLAIIETANRIIASYAEQGYHDLTVRQLYYVFVSSDLFPEERKWTWTGRRWVRDPAGTINAQPNYKWLCQIISDARRAGLIDWEAIVDRTRYLRQDSSWDTPAAMLADCAEQFTVDFWRTQKVRPEVWIEKDALLGVIASACAPYHLPYTSCRGFTSDSEIWASAQRMRVTTKGGQKPLVIHLGDHDPSGVDMSRDIFDRLQTFAGRDIEVRRLALTIEQVRQYNPPPNPAKESDSRSPAYRRLYGDESWELDALEPTVISQLIAAEMRRIIRRTEWRECERRQAEGREQLSNVADNWETVIANLSP